MAGLGVDPFKIIGVGLGVIALRGPKSLSAGTSIVGHHKRAAATHDGSPLCGSSYWIEELGAKGARQRVYGGILSSGYLPLGAKPCALRCVLPDLADPCGRRAP